eukprot:m51a1_g14567 hypothetical protein (587) ;mRNA; r:1059863-1063097
MAESALAGEQCPILLRVSTTNIVRGKHFEVVCLVRAEWMSANGIERDSIRNAGVRSQVHLEGSEDGPPLLPCPRCCAPRHRQNVVVSPDMVESPEAAPGPGYCNSSRLHLGGRVVIVFRVTGSAGAELARARTEPVVLHAKSNYVPMPRTLKWKDSGPRGGGSSPEGGREDTRDARTPQEETSPGAGGEGQPGEQARDIASEVRALQAMQEEQLRRIRDLDRALLASSSEQRCDASVQCDPLLSTLWPTPALRAKAADAAAAGGGTGMRCLWTRAVVTRGDAAVVAAAASATALALLVAAGTGAASCAALVGEAPASAAAVAASAVEADVAGCEAAQHRLATVTVWWQPWSCTSKVLAEFLSSGDQPEGDSEGDARAAPCAASAASVSSASSAWRLDAGEMICTEASVPRIPRGSITHASVDKMFTAEELRSFCSERNVPGYSRMTKRRLIEVILSSSLAEELFCDRPRAVPLAYCPLVGPIADFTVVQATRVLVPDREAIQAAQRKTVLANYERDEKQRKALAAEAELKQQKKQLKLQKEKVSRMKREAEKASSDLATQKEKLKQSMKSPKMVLSMNVAGYRRIF